MCFCAVCGRVAPWTGPAHCVHLLCCWCSGCLQHHRYSHPEIVSLIHTNTRTGWMTRATRKCCDLAACYLGVVLAKLCVFTVARCQRIPGRCRSRCLSALCLWTHSIRMCPLSHEKLKFSRLLSLSDPSARLPSPREVMSVGDVAVSVCCAASVKPVFSLIQPNCNFSALYTPAPHSTCLLQLGPCHAEPCTSLMLSCSLSSVAALAGCWVFPQMLSLRINRYFKTHIY